MDTSTTSPHRPTVLYVDDEPQNLRSFKASFRRDYDIHLAQNGREALEILRKTPVDLILSDQRMPQMTGVELFEQIIEEFPEPIRMVVTGYSDMQAVIEAINKGKVYHFISKPWNTQDLKLVMDKAFESLQMKRKIQLLQEEKNKLLLLAERQKKENILSQFETLKNQVNPHFLFNCLNALSMLVLEDGKKAEQFISKLTKVYRYVLDYRNLNVIPLGEEMRFLENYLFLQKIRFEEGLDIEVDIQPKAHVRLVPPLSLQLLVENALKHNIISKSKPLQLQIYQEDEDLIVKNNLQLRSEKEASTGIGLENLHQRYALLSERLPQFSQSPTTYEARIPLLDPEINTPFSE